MSVTHQKRLAREASKYNDLAHTAGYMDIYDAASDVLLIRPSIVACTLNRDDLSVVINELCLKIR